MGREVEVALSVLEEAEGEVEAAGLALARLEDETHDADKVHAIACGKYNRARAAWFAAKDRAAARDEEPDAT